MNDAQGPVLVAYRKRGLSILESWCGPGPLQPAEADLLRVYHCPTPQRRWLHRPLSTVLVDLAVDDACLVARMRPTTRTDIRRADQRDALSHGWDQSETGRARFVEFHDRFSAWKGLRPLDRTWLAAVAGTGCLRISSVTGVDSEPLVAHAYLCGPARSALLLSATAARDDLPPQARALLGRANRWGHWRDMVDLRAIGITRYDLGGWYEGDQDGSLVAVNRFKESFGGRVTREYVCERPSTPKGAAYLCARLMRDQARRRKER